MALTSAARVGCLAQLLYSGVERDPSEVSYFFGHPSSAVCTYEASCCIFGISFGQFCSEACQEDAAFLCIFVALLIVLSFKGPSSFCRKTAEFHMVYVANSSKLDQPSTRVVTL